MQVYLASEASGNRRRMAILMVDATDGFTPVTGLTLTVTVSKNGAAFAASAGTKTEVGNGVYYYEFTASEVDTFGFISIRVTGDASRTFYGLGQVVAYDAYDANDLGLFSVDDTHTRVIDVQSRLPAALVGGRMDSSVGAMATDTLTAAALATSAVTEIQTGLATSAAVAAVQADTDDIQTRLPAVLIGGRMDSSVGAMATDVITAAALSAGAVTEIQTGLATSAAVAAIQADTDDIQTRLPAVLVGGRMDSSVGAMATDTLTAAALAASAVTEIQTGLATSAAVAAIQADTDDIQTRLPAVLVGGRMDSSVGAMAVDTLTAAALAASAVTEIQTGLATSAAVAAVQTDVSVIKGLSNGNLMLDNTVYDVDGLMTSGRLRVFSTGLATTNATPGAAVPQIVVGGVEIADFQITASGVGGKPTVYESAQIYP